MSSNAAARCVFSPFPVFSLVSGSRTAPTAAVQSFLWLPYANSCETFLLHRSVQSVHGHLQLSFCRGHRPLRRIPQTITDGSRCVEPGTRGDVLKACAPERAPPLPCRAQAVVRHWAGTALRTVTQASLSAPPNTLSLPASFSLPPPSRSSQRRRRPSSSELSA